MLQKFILCLFITLSFSTAIAQSDKQRFVLKKNGIYKHSVLSTHPFGIFFSRLNQNFKIRPSEKNELSISLESGNIWGPNVKTYIPTDPNVQQEIGDIFWDQRQYFIDEDTISAQTFEIKTDGVIKGLRANMSFRINKNQEFNIGIRSFLLTSGKMPYSIFTSDEFIETFHEKIAGGSDPFDRSVFGLNEADIRYLDRNGRLLQLEENDFIFGGIETAYYYYPEGLINEKQNFHMNFGAHVGINLSNYNRSLDLGLTASAIKQVSAFRKNDFSIGLGLGILRKNVADYNTENIEFGTNKSIGNLESAIEYHFVSKGKTTHAFSANYYLQTSLNKKKEFDYIIPIRPDNGHKAWAHGTTNTYRNSNYWTFMYTFSRKIATSVYLQQDLYVNNNPDLQTGISVRFGL